jgi:hypothetical protein
MDQGTDCWHKQKYAYFEFSKNERKLFLDSFFKQLYEAWSGQKTIQAIKHSFKSMDFNVTSATRVLIQYY